MKNQATPWSGWGGQVQPFLLLICRYCGRNKSRDMLSKIPAILQFHLQLYTKDAKNSYNSLYLYIFLFVHLYTLIEIIFKRTHLIEDQQVNNDFINMEDLFPISRMHAVQFFFSKYNKNFWLWSFPENVPSCLDTPLNN